MTQYHRYLSKQDLKFLYDYPDREYLVRSHWTWLEQQPSKDLRAYIQKLESIDGFGVEFIFSKRPDMRTKKGLLEVISRYYNRIR